ncbi:RhoGAP-domain-containing protein [Phanerochaete sordida]|uniref:RhoGAP-domain-containing protein n=1 Tax=Phanerochaete sordida TaxID=48140 RepID=A0A9P3GP03_9APHY|nr:RhoGAP-domain-containing protein [Phanerochaete sordida]
MPVSLAPNPSSPRSASNRQDAADVSRRADSHPDIPPTPQVQVNGRPANTSISIPATAAQPRPSLSSAGPASDGTGWGANFWVTLVDPQTGVSFFACPATGEVSWDPPVGNFLLPPSEEGEWWEMVDEESGLPYYYHTKTGDTVWEKPAQAFVIPLRVLQNTALSRRLSLTNRHSKVDPDSPLKAESSGNKPSYRRSRSYANDMDSSPAALQAQNDARPRRRSHSAARPHTAQSPNSSPSPSPGSSKAARQSLRRSLSSDRFGTNSASVSPLSYERGHPLAPIPGSPYATDASPPPSPSTKRKQSLTSSRRDRDTGKAPTASAGGTPPRDTPPRESPKRKSAASDASVARTRSSKSTHSAKLVSYHAPVPQSLSAALEKIGMSASQSSSTSAHDSPDPPRPSQQLATPERPRQSVSLGRASGASIARPRVSTEPARSFQHPGGTATAPSSPRRDPSAPSPTPAQGTFVNGNGANGMPRLVGRQISAPVFDVEATLNMTPVKMRNAGRPILVERNEVPRASMNPSGRPPLDEELGMYFEAKRRTSLHTGTYPALPDDLASDIQQFSESQFAKQYFSTHRTGFIFRRKVPVEQMMTWQKGPLSSPLLQLSKHLHKEAIKTFKAIQRVMGDRDRPHNGSTTSLVASNALLEEERALLGDGITHGELRDEIYCQVMKQLTGNPNPESVFRGWQLLCVLLVTFPPSKNFEASLRSFISQATHTQEGRVDVMAKYCLRRLEYISRKGPRGKPPTLTEIESASDAAFHPSIFGESLDGIFRLQERNYPQQKVPIILPFLADGILALGGTKAEGIFRVPGDGDLVSELKLRIDKGYYTLDGFDDPHVLASLLKLWLRELADPLVPDEMYNDCIAESRDPAACVRLVHRLPTINRRVVLFVVSFLQLFLDEKVQGITKMTAPNLALVMAPNLLRCNSESMAVVFTNAQYEQAFVHNLLLHLKCDEVDRDYVPAHGRGAIPSPPPPAQQRNAKPAKARHRSNS